MTKKIGLCVTFVTVLAVCTWRMMARTSSSDGAKPTSGFQVSANPLNEPDKFAWEMFADINRSAGDGTNSVVWETWATDLDLYGDPNATPDWNKRHVNVLRLKPITQLELLQEQIQLERNESLTLRPQFIPGQQGGEEVRINKATFDFVVAHKLWYLEGQEEAFKQKLAVAFPQESREIKAVWMPIDPAQKAGYHWQYDKTDGKTYGLVAIHIISKDAPNWTWATFEHVANKERCMVLTCKDAFGAAPRIGKDTQPSPELQALFRSAGLGSEWLNYRLDGTQSDFTDSTGRVTLLGNSLLEGPFIETSSCLTCHARSTVNATGNRLSVFNANHKSHNGTPDAQWFYDNPGASNESVKFLQLDFVWSLLNAQSRSGQVTPFTKVLKEGVTHLTH